MRIADRKTPLEFETDSTVQGRALVVSVYPHYIEVRQKGLRSGFAVPWEALYECGGKLAAAKAAAEKRAGSRSK